MFQRWHLKKAHARFLSSCRNLKEGRDYWGNTGGLARWFSELITPIPLLGLHGDGKLLLDALQWLESHCRKQQLTEQEIRHYHQLIYRDSEHAGIYRTHDILMDQSVIRRRPPQKVTSSMKELSRWLAEVQKRFDESARPDTEEVLKIAVQAHHKIGLIHPFVDGNGRVARLSMNHLLRRYGIGYVIYPPLSESPAFWDALQEGHRGTLDPLLKFAASNLHRI